MANDQLHIREATGDDREEVWEIIRVIISGGDTYAFAPDTPKEELMRYWFAADAHPFVALLHGQIVGTYVIRNNQPGLGSHIANGSFMASPAFRGQHVGRRMGLHALKSARSFGYLAMQFNFVVKSNVRAVSLWEDLGFRIMAEIPEAFRHSQQGLTSVYIMHRSLDDQ